MQYSVGVPNLFRKWAVALGAVMSLSLLAAAPAAAQVDAGNIDLSVGAPSNTVVNVSGPAGSTVTVSGNLVNQNGTDLFINGTNSSTSDGEITIVPRPELLSVGQMGPGDTLSALPLFDVILSGLATPGAYTGSFQILGGETLADNALLATITLDIIVTASGGGSGSDAPEGDMLYAALVAVPLLLAAKRFRDRKTPATLAA